MHYLPSFQGCDPVILFVGRMEFASLEANLVGVRVILFISLSFLLKEFHMTEILFTGTLSLNSINQSIFLSFNFSSCFGFRKFELKKRFKCLNAVKQRPALPIGALSAYAELAKFRPRLEAGRPVLPLKGSYHKVSTEMSGTKEAQARQWHTQCWC